MKKNISSIPKIGVISVTDAPREQGLVREREEYINCAHRELIAYLESSNIEVVDVSQKIERPNPDWVSIHSTSHARECIKIMANEDVEALVIGCWHWCEPMLIVALAREFNKPILLYSDGNPAWAGVTLISAAGASLWQNASNPYLITHKRVYVNKEEVVKWAKGVAAVEKLKKGSLILWGGSYALKMEYLQDDYSKLRSFLVGDVINEDQYMLIRDSEKIPQSRLKKFANWLKDNNTAIKFDSEILTQEIFYKQIALYLAAKDRIDEFEDVAGVSVKCFGTFRYLWGRCLFYAVFPAIF